MKSYLLISPTLRLIVILFLTLWVFPANLRAKEPGEWITTKINGEEYISIAQIQEFHHLDRLTREDSSISIQNDRISLKMKVGSTECLSNGIKVNFAKPVAEADGTIYVSRVDVAGLLEPVLRPNAILTAEPFKTVILDPAGGGEEAHATTNLKFANLAKSILETKGHKVIMTRDGEASPSDQKRVEAANSIKDSAIFIRIAFNSGTGVERGVETIAISSSKDDESEPSDTAQGFDAASVALSTAIHCSILRNIGKFGEDAGISRGSEQGLPEIHHPAIVIKTGTFPDKEDARIPDSDTYLKSFATGIWEGVAKYRFAATKLPRNFPKPGAE